MSTHFNIDYSNFNDEPSPIKSDVNIKVSHNKLTSQKQNAIARAKWGEKNLEKSTKIAVSGGKKTFKKKIGIHAETFEVKSERAKKNYKEGKGFGKLTKQEQRDIGKQYGKQNLISEIICEKCGNRVNKGNYAQSHGKKCRELDKIKLINALPDIFTKQIVKETAIKLNIIDWKKLNILHNTCKYTTIHIKVDKPNQFNPCWYKKTI